MQIKTKLSKSKIIMVATTPLLNSKKWINARQKVGRLGLTCLKVTNTTLRRLLGESSLKLCTTLVSGSLVILTPSTLFSVTKIAKLKTALQPEFSVLALILNGKPYFFSTITRITTKTYVASRLRLVGNFNQIAKNQIKLYGLVKKFLSK